MGQLFNMDNPFFRAMGKLMDLIILNLICTICCIPVITIGPALTALFYVTMKMVKNEEGYIVQGFFKSFRQNLKQGILINLLMLGFGFFLIMDFRILNTLGNSHKIVFTLLIFVSVIYVFVFLYLYPVLAKFDNTIRNTLLNSLMMALSNLPYTLLMLFITIAPFLVLYFTPIERIQSLLLLFLFLFGGSLIAYANSFFFVRIFDKLIPAQEDAAPSSDLDFKIPVPEESTAPAKEHIGNDTGTEKPGEAAADSESGS